MRPSSAAVRRLTSALQARVTGDSSWLLLGETLNRGGRFLLLLLLAREVGAANYGGWVLAIAAATILANAGDAGIGTIATRDIAADRDRTKRYYASLLGLTPLLALLGIGVVLVLTALAPGGASRTLMLLVGLGGVLESAGYLLLSPLRGRGRFLPEGLFRASQGLVLLAAGSVAVLLSHGDVNIIAPLFPLTALVALGIAAITITRHLGIVRPSFDPVLAKHLIRSALPLFASTIVFFVYFRIDAYILAYVQGDEATGLYGAAYNFAFGLSFLPLMLGRVALTRFSSSQTIGELRQAYLRTIRNVGAFAAGISALLVLIAPLFLIFYGNEFAGAQTPYVLLIAAQAIFFFTHLNYVLIIARGRTRLAWGLTLVALSINLVANGILIPLFSVTGAALAMLLSEAVLLCIQAVIVHRELRFATNDPATLAMESTIGEEPELHAA